MALSNTAETAERLFLGLLADDFRWATGELLDLVGIKVGDQQVAREVFWGSLLPRVSIKDGQVSLNRYLSPNSFLEGCVIGLVKVSTNYGVRMAQEELVAWLGEHYGRPEATWVAFERMRHANRIKIVDGSPPWVDAT